MNICHLQGQLEPATNAEIENICRCRGQMNKLIPVYPIIAFRHRKQFAFRGPNISLAYIRIVSYVRKSCPRLVPGLHVSRDACRATLYSGDCSARTHLGWLRGNLRAACNEWSHSPSGTFMPQAVPGHVPCACAPAHSSSRPRTLSCCRRTPAFRPRIVPVLPQLRARARSARRALEPRANGAPAPAAAVRTVGMASGGSCSLPDEGEKLPPSAIAVACTAQGAGPGAAERSNALGGEY